MYLEASGVQAELFFFFEKHVMRLWITKWTFEQLTFLRSIFFMYLSIHFCTILSIIRSTLAHFHNQERKQFLM